MFDGLYFRDMTSSQWELRFLKYVCFIAVQVWLNRLFSTILDVLWRHGECWLSKDMIPKRTHSAYCKGDTRLTG